MSKKGQNTVILQIRVKIRDLHNSHQQLTVPLDARLRGILWELDQAINPLFNLNITKEETTGHCVFPDGEQWGVHHTTNEAFLHKI